MGTKILAGTKENAFSGTELYDLDTIIFRGCFATEKKRYHAVFPSGTSYEFENKTQYNAWKKMGDWGEHEVHCEHFVAPLEHAIQACNTIIEGCHNVLGGLEQRFFLSGQENFRTAIASVRPYKGNRDPKQRPVHLQAVREYYVRYHFATICEGEADDGIGSASNATSCIITNDKDLKQIPGWHYNFVTKELKYIGKREAGLYFFQQLLSGDPTDNVPGIEGLGEAGAIAILDGCSGVREAETRVLQAYQKRYGVGEGNKRFLETGRLVKIKQHEKEGLWAPRFVLQDGEGEMGKVEAGSEGTEPVGQGGDSV